MKLSSLVLALALAGSSAKLEVNSKVRGMLQCACKSIHCARRFPAIEASLGDPYDDLVDNCLEF